MNLLAYFFKSQVYLRIAFSMLLFMAVFIWLFFLGGAIETGGDALDVWNNINDYLYNDKIPELNHHTLRWGLYLPTTFIISLTHGMFSFNPLVYHVVMPLFGAGVAVFIFLLMSNARLTIAQQISVLILIIAVMILSVNERAFTQLLPSGFFVFYMLGALYFIKLAFSEEGWKKAVFFFIAGLFAFFTYGAKLTSLFFIAPLVLFIFYSSVKRKYFSQAIFFIIPLLIGLIIETVILYDLTGYQYGRALYAVSNNTSHGTLVSRLSNLSNTTSSAPVKNRTPRVVKAPLPLPVTQASPKLLADSSVANKQRIQEAIKPPQTKSKITLPKGTGFVTFSEYISSPEKYFIAYEWYSLVIYLAVLLSVIKLFFGKNDLFETCLMWVIIAFFILQSYVVVGVSPYIFPEKYIHARYQHPLLMLCMTFWLYEYVAMLKLKYAKGRKLLVGSIAFLIISLVSLSDNVLSKHRNYGVLTTVFHSKILMEWLKPIAVVGYREEIQKFSDGSVNIKGGLSQFSRYEIVENYVYALTRLDYCHYKKAKYYVDDEYMYGLCDTWQPNSTILFYSPTNWFFGSPNKLRYLGKYSEL